MAILQSLMPSKAPLALRRALRWAERTGGTVDDAVGDGLSSHSKCKDYTRTRL